MVTARGKLRIYLGAAPGVGKTYTMLEEGCRRRARGGDVAIGFVEIHGRPNTAAQIRDLPVIPRRALTYRGRAVEEMDVDAVLARHPAVALVDELAHTNVPGSRNAKRWQDVDELCEAGETKERILVALSGGANGEMLVRRGARMAARGHGELLAVHVRIPDGTVQPSPAALPAQRTLVSELKGTYTEITGADVATALLNFAAAENASQLLLGRSGHRRLYQLTHGSVIKEVIQRAGPVDVHVISTSRPWPQGLPRSPRRRRPVPVPLRRRQLGWLLGTAGVGLLATALSPLRVPLGLPGALLCLLLAVVAVAFVGGLRPAGAATITASLTADFFFVQPIYSLYVAHPVDVVALVVFFAVAGIVSILIDRLARRSIQVARARGEAEALARLAGRSIVAGAQSLPALVAELRRTFDLDSAAILVPDGRQWQSLAEAGGPAPAHPEDATFAAELDQGAVLTLSGRSLSGEDTRLLGPFVTQLRLAQERARLERDASAAAQLAEADTVRTALLEAVSHDLRAPLTTIKAAVTSLLSADTVWSRATARTFCKTIDSETDRLTGLVSNLLDMSRLRAGALPLAARDTDLEEVLYDAVNSLSSSGSAVAIDLPGQLPAVWADPGLLERAVANVMANAQAASPAGLAVRVQAGTLGGRAEIRVIDQGPGIPAGQREHLFQPFQRRGDSAGGLGLGLAIAKGFTEAMDGNLTVEDTPGGGATFVFSLPRADGRYRDEEPQIRAG